LLGEGFCQNGGAEKQKAKKDCQKIPIHSCCFRGYVN
jgi:hypothetical protein